jgi:hypothetical protein
MYGKIPKPIKKEYYKKSLMRSSWEVKFAKYCIKKHIKYRYEFKTFELYNRTYTPDFYLPETDEYIEIKGYYRKSAKYKIRKFRRKYPNIRFKILRKRDLLKMKII